MLNNLNIFILLTISFGSVLSQTIASTPYVIPRPTCPVGYELRGSSCFPLNTNCNYQPINYPCPFSVPPPSQPQPAPIVAQPPPVRPTPVCPENFQWNGQSCVNQTTVEPVCPPDYTLSNYQCERTISATCPTGYEQSNSRCVSTIEEDVYCPPGYNYENENCIRNVQPQCPMGYNLVDGQCESSVEATCYNGQKQNGKCVRDSYTEIRCPYSYVWNGEECISHTQHICDDGYNLVNGKCIQEIYSKPSLKCQEGYILQGDFCYSVESNPAPQPPPPAPLILQPASPCYPGLTCPQRSPCSTGYCNQNVAQPCQGGRCY